MKSTQVFFSDGKLHCVALEVNDLEEFVVRNVCSVCGYKGAIKWNPFNKITQCHNCGQSYIKEDMKEVVQFT
jgi:hypothetical protein